MHKANVYVKVLEKRREKQNAENNDWKNNGIWND
jgi:hypothetical protein